MKSKATMKKYLKSSLIVVALSLSLLGGQVLDVKASPGMVTDDLSTGLTPTDLVNILLGGGVTVSNITFQGVNHSAGTFSGGTGIIGFESGIILSTGNIADVVGPNTEDSTTTHNGLPGDAVLNSLIIGYTTLDATVLEFDFVPTSNVIVFEYVFGSEEYNEYVNTAFNDVFGFFINGVNQALIPSTSVPVSINNVNGGGPSYGTNPSNSAYYINNDLQDGGGLINTELDGMTVVLSVVANVTPSQTNHIRLAIADASDSILDSDVFIKMASFTAPALTLAPLTDTNPLGSSHTLTATLINEDGNPIPGGVITFTVTTGPNAGVTGTDVTDANGEATWNYIGVSPGIDTIVATGAGETSNDAFKTWEAGPVVELCPDEYRWGDPAPGYSYDNWPIFESWVEVHFVNSGASDAYNVTATISYAPVNVTVVDGNVALGDIPAGGSAWSTGDTFTLQVDMSNPQDPNEGIEWRVEYDDTAGVHHVVENVPEFCPPG